MTEIAGIKLGGALGLNPPLLAGSIFYDRDRTVYDQHHGEFDRSRAAMLLREQELWSDRTGIPCSVDIVASTPEAMRHYVTFVATNTRAALLIDGSSEDVRIAGLEQCQSMNIIDRAILNSITAHTTDLELEAIRRFGCKNAVLLAYNPTDYSAKGKLKVFYDSLLTKAKQAGLNNFIIDTAVIDLPSLGTGSEVMSSFKKGGFLVGNSPHNAISRWKGLTAKMGQPAVDPCMAAANAIAVAWGSDFVLYGPISHAGLIFPAVAMTVGSLGQLLIESGNKLPPAHPLFKIA